MEMRSVARFSRVRTPQADPQVSPQSLQHRMHHVTQVEAGVEDAADLEQQAELAYLASDLGGRDGRRHLLPKRSLDLMALTNVPPIGQQSA